MGEPELDRIERRLTEVIRKSLPIARRDSTPVKQAICDAIDELERHAQPPKQLFEINCSGAGYGRSQWLYDLTWSRITRLQEGYVTNYLELVAEIEMSHLDRVMDGDFVKLVQANAQHRLFVFNIEAMAPTIGEVVGETAVNHYLDRCVTHVREFKYSVAGARFLLIGLFDRCARARGMLYVHNVSSDVMPAPFAL